MFDLKSILKEKYLFYLIILINTLPVLLIRFFPTMDSGSHLYNANLLKILLLDHGSVLHDFYKINNYPLPNWLGHALLAMFLTVFKPFMAEKILLLLYLVLLPLAFRYLVGNFKTGNILISYLIFPFTCNFPFLLGFYNQSIAMVLLLFSTGYWMKHQSGLTIKSGLIMALLISLTYFSHFFIFTILFIFLIIASLQAEIGDYIHGNQSISEGLKRFIRRNIFITMVFLIWFAVGFYFIRHTDFRQTYLKYPLSALLSWLFNIRPLIIFGMGEKNFTRPLFLILTFLTAYPMYMRLREFFRIGEGKNLLKIFRASDIWLLTMLLIFGLYLVLPDSMSAGMLSLRLCLLLFIVLLFWLSCQSYPRRMLVIAILLLVLPLHFISLAKKIPTFTAFSRDASQISQAADYIKPNSIVLPLNFDPHWYKGHFINYLGATRSIILLDNYEATYGWFPVNWNLQKMPATLINGQTYLPDAWWMNNDKSAARQNVDYVFLSGDETMTSDPKYLRLRAELEKSFRLIYHSDDNKVQLFELAARLTP